jgi:hypothetical protein
MFRPAEAAEAAESAETPADSARRCARSLALTVAAASPVQMELKAKARLRRAAGPVSQVRRSFAVQTEPFSVAISREAQLERALRPERGPERVSQQERAPLSGFRSSSQRVPPRMPP